MVRIAIVGATGYTARELLRLLAAHPAAEVTLITSRRHVGESLESVHPALKGRYDLTFCEADPAQIEAAADFVFCCLPHAASAAMVVQLGAHLKIVDFSADYRLHDLATYESWYQTRHPDPARQGDVPYGLPELFRDQIKAANLVANPGCFPTSAILPLAPLIENSLVETSDIIVDAKTGVSGAGRDPRPRFHFPEANESVAAYSVGAHRHQPEMAELLERKTGRPVSMTFTPHLIPMNQGILSTIYAKPTAGITPEQIIDCWTQVYADEPFIRMVDRAPATADVQNSNFCDLWCGRSGDRMVIVSAIDNLIKGASGAAVQNFNLMNGLPETSGLV